MGSRLQFQVFIVTIGALQGICAINHESSLFWTEQVSKDRQEVVIRGVPGDPSDWARSGRVAAKREHLFQLRLAGSAQMLALGFRYSTQELFFTDRSLKSIFRVELKYVEEMYENSELPDVTGIPPSHPDYGFNATRMNNYTLEVVYSGISADANGLAVDWLSGALYWTDARYNWIAVASTRHYAPFKDVVLGQAPRNFETYKYLITTDLDKPMGIAVYPKNGWMFWSNRGAVPKIERARLDGTDRVVIVEAGDHLVRPGGVTIDYPEKHLYWVDGGLGTIGRCNMDGSNRITIQVQHFSLANSDLHGIAVFEEFIFIGNQARHTMGIYDKTKKELVRDLLMGPSSIPYDLMMYNEHMQEESESECSTLKCQHLCINIGYGRAKCECGNGYELQDDKVSCERSSQTIKPRYIYSMGDSLCSAKIYFADRLFPATEDAGCFVSGLGHVEALAFNSYADLIFFSDSDRRVIYRKRMKGEKEMEVLTALTGRVRGLAVDWLSLNLYWTDEDYGHVMVTDMDGRYPRVLLENLERPRGIAIDPHRGVMYWSSAGDDGCIYKANMDGTNVRVFLSDGIHEPEGLLLNLNTDKLYWADSGRAGVGISNLLGNKTERLFMDLLQTATFTDVTVYQSYLAATHGDDTVYLMHVDDGKVQRGIRHMGVNVSHDIITYDDYLQPLADSVCNGQCQQLCLPSPRSSQGYTCQCALGFQTIGRHCKSNLKDMDFLLVLDLYHKQAYQLDFAKEASPRKHTLEAMGLTTPEQPTSADYDAANRMLYWFDDKVKAIIRKGQASTNEETVMTLPAGSEIGVMCIDEIGQYLLYTDIAAGRIKFILLNSGRYSSRNFLNRDILPRTVTIDKKSQIVYWAENTTSGTPVFYSQHTLRDSPPKLLTPTDDGVLSSLFAVDVSGMTVDVTDALLYAWTHNGAILRVDPDEGQTEVVHRIHTRRYNVSNMAVAHGWLYYTLQNSKTIYRQDLSDLESPAEAMTADVFAHIAVLKAVVYYGRDWPTRSTLATPGGEQAASSSSSSNSTILIAIGGAIAASGLVLAVLVAIYCMMRRRRRKSASRPRVPPSDFNTQSHDNPVYMTTKELQARRPGSEGATANLTVSPASVAPSPEKKMPLPDTPPPLADDALSQISHISQISHSTDGATGGKTLDSDGTLSSLKIDSKNKKVSFAP